MTQERTALQLSGWQVLLFQLNGNGTERFIRGDVPLSNLSASKVLSGPHQIGGQLDVPIKDLQLADGSPLLKRWKTTVYLQDPNGEIWVGGILIDYTIDGPALTLDVSGFTTYAKDQPYDAEYNQQGVDPLDVMRSIWDHLQLQPGADLGLVIDSLSTPVRIGVPAAAAPAAVSNAAPPPAEEITAAQAIQDRLNSGQPIFEDWTWAGCPPEVSLYNDDLLDRYNGDVNNKPSSVAWLGTFIAGGQASTTTSTSTTTDTSENESVSSTGEAIKLNWWSTDDCGGDIDTLAKDTPFDYLERHQWNGDVIDHRVELGYPGIGSRKPNLRFVLNENVYKIPSETYSEEDVVTEVWVMGAGEGRSRIRGVARVFPRDSLRRVKIIDDKTIATQDQADCRARDELSAYQPDMPGAGITELQVSNHGNAPFGSYDVGDEIIYSGDHDWGDVAIWVKITKMTVSPEKGDDVTISVVRTDTLNA